MGPFATAIAYGCLTALRWLCWITAGLLVVLIITQYLRGDDWARPGGNALLGAGMAAAGWLSGFVAERIVRASR
jgi:hypothetical protein